MSVDQWVETHVSGMLPRSSSKTTGFPDDPNYRGRQGGHDLRTSLSKEWEAKKE